MQRNRFRLTLTAAALAALCLRANAQTAQFDIPAQPLADALARFAQQSGVQLVFSPALGTGKTSQPVHGAHNAEAALRQLLRGSGLEARHNGATWTLAPAPLGADTTLGEVKVTGQTERNAATEDSGSYATRGATLFKGVQSLKDIPQSVTVITRQQMDDQGLETVEEVLANTPGVTVYKRPGGGSDFYSRGFQAPNIQYDGVPLLRTSSWGNTFTASSAYLDRIEVLRGAQGLLEGAGNPGGAINLVRKRGLAEKTLKIDGRIGSWDNYGARLETGGALDNEGRVRSRVVLDYEDKRSFIDTIHDRGLNAYAALDFDATPDTSVGFGIAHSGLNGASLTGTGILRHADGSALDIPRSTYMGAGWNDAKRRETQVFLDLDHRISSNWKFKFSSTYVNEKYDSTESTASGDVPLNGGTVGSWGYIYDYGAESLGFDATLSGRFNTFGIAHDVVLGGNYAKQRRDDGYIQYKNHTTYDVFHLNHDAPRLGTTAPTQIVDAERETLQKGLYGMLRSHMTDDLALVLGGRASWYRYAMRTEISTAATTYQDMKEKGIFTPYAGVVYALTPQWSLYASYADIFQPQTATDVQLNVLQPIVGTNYETGIKGELFDGKLNISTAVFRVDQKNRAVRDDDAPMVCGNGGNGYCSRAAGKVRSEGIEMEAHGQLARGWQVSGGYTYSRNEYMEDRIPSNIGKPFDYNSPQHMLRLWSDWQLPGEWSKWRFGTGVNYRSKQRTGNATKVDPVQGGYSIWNARVAYQVNKTWSAALNIENLFDKYYYASIYNSYNVSQFGAPRNFLLTLRGNF